MATPAIPVVEVNGTSMVAVTLKLNYDSSTAFCSTLGGNLAPVKTEDIIVSVCDNTRVKLTNHIWWRIGLFFEDTTGTWSDGSRYDSSSYARGEALNNITSFTTLDSCLYGCDVYLECDTSGVIKPPRTAPPHKIWKYQAYENMIERFLCDNTTPSFPLTSPTRNPPTSGMIPPNVIVFADRLTTPGGVSETSVTGLADSGSESSTPVLLIVFFLLCGIAGLMLLGIIVQQRLRKSKPPQQGTGTQSPPQHHRRRTILNLESPMNEQVWIEKFAC